MKINSLFSVLDDTQTGRKVKDAFQETSNYLGEKSRSAGLFFGQAKTSFLNSLFRGSTQTNSSSNN